MTYPHMGKNVIFIRLLIHILKKKEFVGAHDSIKLNEINIHRPIYSLRLLLLTLGLHLSCS